MLCNFYKVVRVCGQVHALLIIKIWEDLVKGSGVMGV